MTKHTEDCRMERPHRLRLQIRTDSRYSFWLDYAWMRRAGMTRAQAIDFCRERYRW